MKNKLLSTRDHRSNTHVLLCFVSRNKWVLHGQTRPQFSDNIMVYAVGERDVWGLGRLLNNQRPPKFSTYKIIRTYACTEVGLHVVFRYRYNWYVYHSIHSHRDGRGDRNSFANKKLRSIAVRDHTCFPRARDARLPA